MNRKRLTRSPAANSRQHFCFLRIVEIRCYQASSKLGFLAAVAVRLW